MSEELREWLADGLEEEDTRNDITQIRIWRDKAPWRNDEGYDKFKSDLFQSQRRVIDQYRSLAGAISKIQLLYRDETWRAHGTTRLDESSWYDCDTWNLQAGEKLVEIRACHDNGELKGCQFIMSSGRKSPMYGNNSPLQFFKASADDPIVDIQRADAPFGTILSVVKGLYTNKRLNNMVAHCGEHGIKGPKTFRGLGEGDMQGFVRELDPGARGFFLREWNEHNGKQVSLSQKSQKRPRSGDDPSDTWASVAETVASSGRAIRQRMNDPEVQERITTGLAMCAAGASALAGWMSKK